MTKPDVLSFIRKHSIMVVSTVSPEGSPGAAVVEFAETDDLKLIFDTSNTSTKYVNLKANSKVACVIGWDDNITVQYEGTAQEMTGDELEKAKNVYFAKNPDAAKWSKEPDIAYFEVAPTKVKYTDLNKSPWLIFELNEKDLGAI